MSKVLIIPNTGSAFANVAVDTVTPIEGDVAINVVASPEGGGTATGTGGYSEGAEVTISATPSTGYEFVQWNDGNTNATRTIIVGTTSTTYTATFRQCAKILFKKGYLKDRAGIADITYRAVFAAINPTNVNEYKSATIDGVVYSAIYIPSGKTTLSYSVKNGYMAIAAINDGTTTTNLFEPSVGWTTSYSYSVSSYVGMYVAFSVKKPNDAKFTNSDTEESIGLTFSLT